MSLAHDYCAERKAVWEPCDYGAERRSVEWCAITVRNGEGEAYRAITGRNGGRRGACDYGTERRGYDYGAEWREGVIAEIPNG